MMLPVSVPLGGRLDREQRIGRGLEEG